MAENKDAIERLFAKIRSFEWDEEKRRTNLRKHGIDFADAARVLDGPTVIRRSDRHGEVRYQVIGVVEGREVALACSLESERCRIISARRARRDERRKYHRDLARRPQPDDGQD